MTERDGLLVDGTLRLAALVLSLALHLLGVVASDGADQVLRKWQQTVRQNDGRQARS